MNFFLEKYNALADKVVGAEVEMILKPLGELLKEGFLQLGIILTDSMPQIGGGITIICAVEMMITGNIPKWFARWGMGMMGVIIWLTAK
jgi:hypothetical protein